jgi:UTP--glucose-1-phosphate uridylyltransferase
VFDLLEKEMAKGSSNLLLTPVLQTMATSEKYLALEVKGNRYDLSRKHGLLRAQVALGLAGKAHNETLTTIVELLAEANVDKVSN